MTGRAGQTRAPELKTAKDLSVRSNRILSIGCNHLNSILEGGIPFFPITEIAGEAGVGKTQLLLTLALTCQLPVGKGGLGGGSLYISTEGMVPVPRLKALAESIPGLKEYLDPETALDNVLVEDRITDASVLWTMISERLPLLLAVGSTKLIIIDSIAALFRGEFSGGEGMRDRNSWFFGLSSMMRRLSDEYDCMFVLANQVSFDPNTKRNKPALGLAWSSCVNQRFILEFYGTAEEENIPPIVINTIEDVSLKRRVLSISYSPQLPSGIVSNTCVVSKRGFHFL